MIILRRIAQAYMDRHCLLAGKADGDRRAQKINALFNQIKENRIARFGHVEGDSEYLQRVKDETVEGLEKAYVCKAFDYATHNRPYYLSMANSFLDNLDIGFVLDVQPEAIEKLFDA